jgi:hypothetical protein
LKIAKGGGWVHVLLDQHPQHEREDQWDFQNNPTSRSATYGFKNYYDTLSTFYIDGIPQIPTPYNLWIDEIEFYHTSTSVQPTQNDESIASVTLGYFPDHDGKWGVGFQGYNEFFGTWEIRYSTSPITNTSFDAATPIAALSSGVPGYPGRVRKLVYDTGYPAVWTEFDLPSSLEIPGSTIYFAIKDVSKTGQHETATIPADNITASNPHIHTIDYYIPNGTPPQGTLAPSAPRGLAVR